MQDICTSTNYVLLTALLLVLAAAPAPAPAAFLVDIGGNVIADSPAGDVNPVPGVIRYIDSASGLNFRFDHGTLTRGNPRGKLLLSNSGASARGYPSPIAIRLTDSGFTPPGAGLGVLKLRLTRNTPVGGGRRSTSQEFHDPAITPFGTGAGNVATGVASTSTFRPGESASDPFELTTPFSLTNVITINLRNQGNAIRPAGKSVQLTSNHVPAAVPEPSSIVLLGTMLVIGGAAVRRHRQKAACSGSVGNGEDVPPLS